MASQVIALPNDESATLIDPDTLTNRARKQILAQADEFPDQRRFAMGFAVTEGVIAMAVESWTLPVPLPSQQITVLDDLPLPTFDALANGIEPFLKRLFPDFNVTPKPNTPTEPSSE